MSDYSKKRDTVLSMAEDESPDDPKPSVGTDPEELPGEAGHKQVAPDEGKVKAADQKKKAREDREPPEEKAERVKNA